MKSKHKFAGRQFEALVSEISKLAVACDVDVLNADSVVKSVRGDDSVCRRKNPTAFRKLRNLLIMLFELEGRALDRLGGQELGVIADELIQKLAALRGVEVPGPYRSAPEPEPDAKRDANPAD